MAKRKPASPESAEGPVTEGGSPYTVLARRYRPQQFSDLIGQEHVAQALTNALRHNRVAHAYLFTGARGVGKTSTARILAKALNCERGPTPTPCDECEICRGIAEGEDVDVLEVDGASNRGIDEIREIRQNVQFRPSRARFKIFIVDEVHMLTREAFNALLKTLEEPPPHVKFFFATTEVQRVPVTILSRCQRFDFAGIRVKDIAAQLQRVVAGEGMRAEPEALELVARRAGGSMRDAESLLDQLLAFGGDVLTAAQVHALLGTAHDDRVTALAQAILGQDPKQALQMLAAAADEGLDLGELLDQFIEYWRDLLVVRCAGTEGQTLSVGSAHEAVLARQAAALAVDTILAGLDVLVATKQKLGRSGHHGRVLVEMALVRLGRLGDLVALTQLSQWLRDPRPAGGNGPPGPRVSADAGGLAKKKDLTGEAGSPGRPTSRDVPRPAGPSPVPGEAADAAASTPSAPQVLTPETLPGIWQAVLQKLDGMLVNSLGKVERVAIFGPNGLEIVFPPRYTFLKVQCQDPVRVRQIETALAAVLGRACSVRIESGPDEAGGGAADDGSTAAPVRPRLGTGSAKVVPPLMQWALDLLDAQELRRDPGFAETETGEP